MPVRATTAEPWGIVAGVLLVAALPIAIHGWPTTWHGNLFAALLLGSGLPLLWWRSQPRIACVATLTLLLAAAAVDGWFPDSAVAIYAAAFALLALGWSGRAALVVACCGVAYVVAFDDVARVDSWVADVVISLPGYAVGTVYRLRLETAEQLARRVAELDEERELLAEIAVRHERARIAAELHDIVGHAISVMVIQAAAGQRLVDSDPARAREAFTAISESARQGTRDLDRLVELLGGREPFGPGGADLAMVEEVVTRAARSGLDVTCRLQGDRSVVSGPVAHLAFRVVQESLTNTMRHAPGAPVAIVLQVDAAGPGLRSLTVDVDNGRPAAAGAPGLGTGHGITGLRERIQALGGGLTAGPTPSGGWLVRARLPLEPPATAPAPSPAPPPAPSPAPSPAPPR